MDILTTAELYTSGYNDKGWFIRQSGYNDKSWVIRQRESGYK